MQAALLFAVSSRRYGRCYHRLSERKIRPKGKSPLALKYVLHLGEQLWRWCAHGKSPSFLPLLCVFGAVSYGVFSRTSGSRRSVDRCRRQTPFRKVLLSLDLCKIQCCPDESVTVLGIWHLFISCSTSVDFCQSRRWVSGAGLSVAKTVVLNSGTVARPEPTSLPRIQAPYLLHR